MLRLKNFKCDQPANRVIPDEIVGKWYHYDGFREFDAILTISFEFPLHLAIGYLK